MVGPMLIVLAWIGIVVAILAMLLAAVACLVGLPGSIGVLVVALILSASTHWERPPWWVVLIFLGVSLVAETVDNLVSAWGTKRYGGSTKGAFWALLGGIAGVLVGGYLGPLVGTLAGPVGSAVGAILGPLLFAFPGGYLGGYWYELRAGQSKQEARRAGWGAFLGRAAGALLKTVLAAGMAGVTVWLLFRAGGPFAG
jgi:uncharacterized protein YqgC (DUF456 family)